MTALTSPTPVTQVARTAPVPSRAGSLAGSPAAQPALALQSTVAATSFADMLAASSHQPAPASSPSPAPAPSADRTGTAQAEADAGSRRTHLPAAAPAHTTQAAAAEDAAPTDDVVDPSATGTAAAAEADQPTGPDTAVATPSHRTRKLANASATDAHAAAAAAQAVAPTAPSAAKASVAVDDAVPATGGHAAGSRVSHGVVASADASGGAGTASTSARQAGVPDQTAALGTAPTPRAGAAAATADADANAALKTAVEAAGPAGAVTGIGALGHVGAAGAASAAALIDPHAAAVPAASDTQVAIATPTDAPDFREALGAQVSVLVQDGVQTAELHLNPADMGPISVRIAMDGAQAKIDFGADSADTRRLIETGLPELASALRDAGFTLSGGGVSDHRQGRSGSDAGDGGRNAVQRTASGGSDADTARRAVSAAALRRTVGAGGVDLYA